MVAEEYLDYLNKAKYEELYKIKYKITFHPNYVYLSGFDDRNNNLIKYEDIDYFRIEKNSLFLFLSEYNLEFEIEDLSVEEIFKCKEILIEKEVIEKTFQTSKNQEINVKEIDSKEDSESEKDEKNWDKLENSSESKPHIANEFHPRNISSNLEIEIGVKILYILILITYLIYYSIYFETLLLYIKNPLLDGSVSFMTYFSISSGFVLLGGIYFLILIFNNKNKLSNNEIK